MDPNNHENGSRHHPSSWNRTAGTTRQHEFLRTYKACISCRVRKAKCELGGNPDKGIPPGPPCLRCRRELKSCHFTETRAWARKKKQSDDAGRSTPEAGEYRSFEAHPAPSTSSHGEIGVSSQPGQLSDIPTLRTPVSYEGDSREEDPGNWPPLPANDPTNDPTNAESTSAERTHDEQKDSKGLANSVMRTVVSSGNDALNILFQAAAQEQASSMNDLATASQRSTTYDDRSKMQPGVPTSYGEPRFVDSFGTTPSTAPGHYSLSAVEPEVLSLWDTCRFVQMGWFSSREAVTYVDLFYKHMAPLSPIISNFYAHHRNHRWLVTQEPVLCCTILMISSRYHILPGVGGASRGFFIHQSLWQQCQHFIMRIMLGQEKGTRATTRTIGTIEALLLMSEWHPRSLHFPPQSDGWDTDLTMSAPPVHRTPMTNDSGLSESSTWLEDVIEPARRSDRMSWMLLGSGLTLAHELGIFDADDSRARSLISCPEIDGKETGVNPRRQRIQQLLYVFINQLASRLGCMSLMPQSLNHTVLAPLSDNSQRSYANVDEWSSFMLSWIELTKLVKSVTDMFFPSATFTRQELSGGGYVELLGHYRPLLLHWRQKYFDTHDLLSPFRDMIFIEYQYARVYINSIGMQAVVERVLAESDPESVVDDIRQANLDEIDYEFIQEVIDGSCHILQKVTELAETGALRFSPVRIFLRITSSSIFLIKALSLGVRNAKLQESLEVLTRSIQALRSSSLDDIHLAARYATLLEVLVSRLRRSFVLNNRPSKASRGATRPSSALRQQSMMEAEHVVPPPEAEDINAYQDLSGNPSHVPPAPAAAGGGFDDPMHALNEINADDWLSLPFDPSMAPFGAGGNQAWSGVDGVGLNFIWNSPL